MKLSVLLLFVVSLSDESDLKDILHEFQENDDIFSIIHEELKDDGQ